MNTPATQHYQELDAAIEELCSLDVSTPEQIEACSDRIQQAWADLRTDYSDLMHQAGVVMLSHPHLADFSNWAQVEEAETSEALQGAKDT